MSMSRHTLVSISPHTLVSMSLSRHTFVSMSMSRHTLVSMSMSRHTLVDMSVCNMLNVPLGNSLKNVLSKDNMTLPDWPYLAITRLLRDSYFR